MVLLVVGVSDKGLELKMMIKMYRLYTHQKIIILHMVNNLIQTKIHSKRPCGITDAVYKLPPRTKPLVAIAEVEQPVMVVTTVAIKTMIQEYAVEIKM